jgi:hypothetical protein
VDSFVELGGKVLGPMIGRTLLMWRFPAWFR